MEWLISTMTKRKRESDNEDTLVPSEILEVSPKAKVQCLVIESSMVSVLSFTDASDVAGTSISLMLKQWPVFIVLTIGCSCTRLCTPLAHRKHDCMCAVYIISMDIHTYIHTHTCKMRYDTGLVASR